MSPTEEEMIALLGKLAPALNSLVKSPDATISYDLLSGSIYWLDERPNAELDDDDLGTFKQFLHYRTKMILGEPEPAFQRYWEAAKRLFPNWPGFSEERCRPDPTLAGYARRTNAQSMLSLSLCDIGCRLDEEFDGRVPHKIIRENADRSDPPEITVGKIHDLTCRCVQLSGKSIPTDSWKRVQRCVAESLDVDPVKVTKDSRLVADLGAG